jgi:HSP20 family protein
MLTRAFYPATYRARTWAPFDGLRQLQSEMDRLMSQTYPRSVDYPPINVWSNEDEVVVQAELPGYAAADIDISVVQNTLTLRGERQPEGLKDGETYHRRERQVGSFVRTVELPFEVDNSAVDAEYVAGILMVRLPRAEAHKPKKIAVKAS